MACAHLSIHKCHPKHFLANDNASRQCLAYERQTVEVHIANRTDESELNTLVMEEVYTTHPCSTCLCDILHDAIGCESTVLDEDTIGCDRE